MSNVQLKLIALFLSLPLLFLFHLIFYGKIDWLDIFVFWLLEGCALFVPNFGWRFGNITNNEKENKLDDDFEKSLKGNDDSKNPLL